jgi:hypothetical protein
MSHYQIWNWLDKVLLGDMWANTPEQAVELYGDYYGLELDKLHAIRVE